MANRVDALDRGGSPGLRRKIKKLTAKARRRDSRQKLEDAGHRLRDYTRGWST